MLRTRSISSVTAIVTRKINPLVRKIGIGSYRFIHHRGIRHGEHAPILGHNTGGSQRDAIYTAILAIDFDQIINCEWPIHENQKSRDDIGQGIFQCEADRQA